MSFKKVDVGTRNNRLTVIEDLGCFVKEGSKTKCHYVKCLCDCGNEVIVTLYGFRSGNTKSCGCLQKERTSKTHKKYNEYEVFEDIVFVKFSNCDEYFICDLEDWEKLKNHCWMKDYNGYAKTKINGKKVRMHRLITNCPDDLVPDHLYQVSRGVLDNRKSNLEVKTQKENSRNKLKQQNNTSGYSGVYWHKQHNKWTARIGVDGKMVNLGLFDDIEDAIKARKQGELKYWGCVNDG